MKGFKSTILAALAVMIAVAYALPALPVSAQSSAALSIAPKKNYTIEPGESVKDKLTIRNLDSEKELSLNLRVVDFTYTDDGGTPKLMLAEDAQPTTWSLKPFLTIPKTVKIAANSSKTVDMGVAIPAKHGAGSYYSAIVYSTGTPDGGNVGLNASGVTLAFVSVPGEVKEDLKLEKFGAYNTAAKDGKGGYTSLTMQAPRNIAFTLKNSGNVTEAPVGSITVKSMFGQQYEITDVNPNASLALIGQTRTFVSCIKIKAEQVDFNGQKTNAKTCDNAGLWPGYYSASLDLFYGQNGNNTKEIFGAASFWYLPLWFIILVVVLIAAIALGVWLTIRKLRNHSPRGRRLKK